MNRIFFRLAIYLTLFCIACSPPQKRRLEQSQNYGYLISNISVLPIDRDGLLLGQTVWIKDNKIQYLGDGKNLKTTGKLHKIDGTGKYLMPGLSDMHVHLPSDDLPSFLQLHLLAGVTNIRSMRGLPEHLELRQKIAKGEILGPSIYCASPPIHGKMELNNTQIDSLFTAYKSAGYDLVKILSVKDYQVFASIAKAAQKHQLPIGGHTPRNVGIKNLLQYPNYSIEHLGGYRTVLKDSETLLDEMIQQTVRTQTYNCPTFDWYNLWQFSIDELRQRKGLEFVPDLVAEWEAKWANYQSNTSPEKREEDIRKTKEQIAQKKIILKKLFDQGAAILISPDATGIFQVPGFSMWEEIKLFRSVGIGNYDILKMATWNAAAYCGKEEQRGSVAEGKNADLIILDKNPLDNLDHLESVSGVFVNGQFIESKVLKQQLSERLSN